MVTRGYLSLRFLGSIASSAAYGTLKSAIEGIIVKCLGNIKVSFVSMEIPPMYGWQAPLAVKTSDEIYRRTFLSMNSRPL